MLRQSLIISGGTLTSYLYGLGRYGVGQKANTQAFMTLTFAQLLQSISSRSRSSSIFRPQGPPANPWLRGALVGSLVMQLGTGLPGVRRIFGVSPMGPVDMAFIAAGSIIPLLINEALKKTDDEGQDSDG
jgi:Ca2+-transporting ATPase